MKRILSVCLAIWLLLTVLSAGTVGVSAARDATVAVSDVSGCAGDTVTVSVRFENNPGLISAKVDIQYDASVLQLVEAVEGDFPSGNYTFGPSTKNPFSILFVNGIAKQNYTDERFATLHFKIKEDAPAGVYPITAICNFEENFFNIEWKAVWFDVQAGSVTVEQSSASATQPTVPSSTATKDSTTTMDTAESPTSAPTVNQSVSSQKNPSVTEEKPSATVTEGQTPTQSVANTTVRPSQTVAKEEENGMERSSLRPIFIALMVLAVVAGVVVVALLLRKQKTATPPEE